MLLKAALLLAALGVVASVLRLRFGVRAGKRKIPAMVEFYEGKRLLEDTVVMPRWYERCGEATAYICFLLALVAVYWACFV